MRLIIALAIMLTTVTAFAEQGFSGYVGAGALFKQTNDALDTGSKFEDIDTLDSNPDSEGSVSPMLLFEVIYQTKNDWVVHFGVPEDNPQPNLSLGVTKLLGNRSSFDVSLIFEPISDVWENPYSLKRDKTTDTAAGISFDYKNIASSKVNVKLDIISHDIDNDESGELHDSLKRDGVETNISISRAFNKGRIFLSPRFNISVDNRDGEAESSKAYGMGMVLGRMGPKGMHGMIMVGFESRQFDKRNPVFDKTREDIEAKLFAMRNFNDPFGWENKFIKVIAGGSKRVSTIDFFDATSLMGGVSFGARF